MKLEQQSQSEYNEINPLYDNIINIQYKYLEKKLIPRQKQHIKQCKYGMSCWNVTCIFTHNNKQEKHYNEFFDKNPYPVKGTKMCRFNNNCKNKNNCTYAHSEKELNEVNKRFNNWEDKRYTYWLDSLYNDISNRRNNFNFNNNKSIKDNIYIQLIDNN